MDIEIKSVLLAVFSAVTGVFFTSQAYDLHAAVILFESGNAMYGYFPHVWIGMFAAIASLLTWLSIIYDNTESSRTRGDSQ